MAAKQKKPILPKKPLIQQLDQEDSTLDSVSEGIVNVRYHFLLIVVLFKSFCVLCALISETVASFSECVYFYYFIIW